MMRNYKYIYTLLFIALIILVLVFIFGKDSSRHELTIEEKNYLESKKEITFISQTSYPPFEFIDDGKSKGMCIELARWMGTEFGFKHKFIDTNFSAAQDAVLNGDADVLTSLFYSESRDQRFDFTQMIWRVPASIFVNIDRPDIVAIKDLAGKNIAIQDGDYAIDYLKGKGVDYNLIPCKSFDEAIGLLVTKEADAIIGDEQIVEYFLYNKELNEKVKKIGEELYSGKNCMAVKEGNTILQSILRKGVLKASKDKILENINHKWIGKNYHSSWLDENIFNLIIGAILTIIALLVFIIWNAQLRSSVDKKTEELNDTLKIKVEAEHQLQVEKRELTKNRTRLSTILNSIGDGVIATDLFGNITELNPVAESLSEYRSEEVIGKKFTSFFTLIDSDSRKGIDGVIEKIISIKEPLTLKGNISLVSKSGKVYQVSESLSPIKNDQNDITGVVITLKNVSNEYKLKKSILENSRKFKTLFEHNPVAVWYEDISEISKIFNQLKSEGVLDLRSYMEDRKSLVMEILSTIVVKDLNSAAIKFHKASSKEDLMENFEKTFTEESFETLKEVVIGLWDGRMEQDYETTFYDLNGDIIYSIVSFVVIKGDKDSLSEILVSMNDITKRKKAERAVIESQRLGAFGEMANAVAHDFNNSLQAMIGNVEMAIHSVGDKYKLLTYLDSIKKSAVDASSRVKMLQRFGGVKNSRSDYDEVEIDNLLKDIVIQSKPIWKDEAERKGFNYKIETELDSGLKSFGNAGELRGVFYNVLKNSIEAMPNGGELTIKSYSNDDTIFILFEDSGIGMDKETRKRIFQPFYTSKGFDVGRGMGLSSAYSIVNEHSGKIFVKSSEIGKGTIIQIELPINKNKSIEVLKKEEINDSEVNLKILWVDDDKVIRTICSEYLDVLGCNGDVVDSGEKALEKLEESEYNLLITDIGMPGMNGWDLSRVVSEKYNLEIAIVTGWGETISEEDMAKYGVKYVLGKPIEIPDLDQLLTKVKQVLA